MRRKVRNYTNIVLLVCGVGASTPTATDTGWDDKFTIVLTQCVFYPATGTLVAKAENPTKRVIIREVHCSNI